MPADQTVEGGAQMRVTQAGFNKLTSILPGLLNNQLSGGFCIPQGSVGSCGGFPDTGACYCVNDNTSCGQNHCKANVSVTSFSVSVPNQNIMRINVGTTLSTQIQIKGSLLGANLGTCTLNISSPNFGGSLDIAVGTKASDGELDIHLDKINQFNLNLDISGCGFLGDIANLVSDLLDSIINSFVGNFVLDLLTPSIDNLIQSMIPNPLGIAGMMDVGNMLESVSPGTDALMEARIVPGGYAFLQNGGMSLGVITGLNADQDPSTRDVGLTSEPSLCVPPFQPPAFDQPPASLPRTTRQTFALGAANEFNGGADNVGNPDVLMGVSETTLDLAGHHMVASGAMCLGIGTSFINQLNVGTIGILVPSLSELQTDNGNDPLLLVTRPQRPLDFTVGDNTPTSPALTIGISHLEVDFYAFLFERYVRAFTLDLTMNVGINLDFQQPAGGPAQIVPSLVGISSQDVQITVLNSQFVRETPAMLEAVLPSVFDLVTPLLGDLPPIDVPSFAGFSLENLSISRVATAQDDFLALKATLGASAAMRQLTDKFSVDALRDMDSFIPAPQPPSTGQAHLVNVTTPAPVAVRSALMQQDGGAMPKVELDVDKVDSHGRQLEWAYNLNNGMFHPFQVPPPGNFVIADRAFAWQGKYTIGLKSRVVGDYRTTSEVTEIPVTIDSVGPRFLTDQADWNGDDYELTMFDIVSGNVVQWALATPGADAPATEWHQGGYAKIARADLEALAIDGEVEVFAKDEAGNTSHVRIAPFHGAPGSAQGCNCDASGGQLTPGTLVLFAMVGLILFGLGRRRRTFHGARRMFRGRARAIVVNGALFVGMSLTMSLVPGCSCSNAGASCELFSDCPDCPPGQIAFCIDGQCVCSDDIVLGRLGPYSDVATGPDGQIWVSAYHAQYGDLVVAKVDPQVGRIPDTAWEWVDGVPDGPVVVPQSLYRHGIAAKGEDVGMYTSIAVAPDGTPEVTYFDRDTGSLRFASRDIDGNWTHHTIEQGTGELGENGALIGMYTALSLRSDTGAPGVAYLAHVSDPQMGPRAEVRFAAAQTVHPTSAADWMTWIVDTAPLPPDDPNNPNIYPLPEGLGLFVDLARMPDQSPVIVYYDRGAGELKESKFDTQTGQFGTALVLDGSGDLDAGWSPSVAVDDQGVVHVAYVDATHDDLVYTTDEMNAAREIVDDGSRIVGTTVDGLPKPEFHFVGDDASLVLANATLLPMIAYQDATTQELLLATRTDDGNGGGTWSRVSVAGATDPWPGGYGFFAADVLSGTDIVMSSWVVDQPNDDNWVEVFRRQVALQ